MQYQIKYNDRVVVGSHRIVNHEHAEQIKAAIDSPAWGVHVEIVEVPEPVIPWEYPKVGYFLYWEDGKDILKLQVRESAYGGWSFVDEGFDRDCRLYERSDGHPHTVLVYATSSDQAVKDAYRIREIFDEQAPQREEMKRRAEADALIFRYEDDDDDDWLEDEDDPIVGG